MNHRMSRSSPSVLRVVAVLNFFADHPGQAFTLTDLVRALKLSRATCHGVLAGLVETGYLYRTTDKSYVLGPALLNVGEMAKAHFSPLQVAQPEMRKLADEFDAVCAAAFREGHDVVVRERAAAVSHLGYSSPRGTRLPLLPQFAPPFFAASSPAEIKTWTTALVPPAKADQLDALDKGVSFVRAHGYLFSIFRPGEDQSTSSRKWLDGQAPIEDTPMLAAYELVDDRTYRLGFVTAPVFDARRRVAFCLALQGVNRDLSGKEIAQVGARVREACDRIASFMDHSPSART